MMNLLKPAFCFVLISSILSGVVSAQEVDTLSFHQPAAGYVYFRNPEIDLQAARFVNPAPGYVREIALALGGPSSTGAARLRVFGHEGGSPAPILEDDLIPPITVRKSKSGFEKIVVSLPERLFLENNQFFVALDQLDSGVVFLSDRVEKEPFCASDDDRFSSQLLRQKNGEWRWEKFSFAVEVVMEYPEIIPATPMGDAAPSLGILDTIEVNRSIAWADVNGDGYLDLLWNGGLYMNDEGERFERADTEFDLTAKPTAHLFLDADNDGKIDILFLGSRDSLRPENRLFLGDGGEHFSRIDLDLPSVVNPTSFSVADVNGDGYLDVFIGQSRRSGDSGGYPSRLWLNAGGKGFIDGSEHIAALTGEMPPSTYGSQFADLDRDGDPDLYAGCLYPGQSILLRNDGAGHFSAEAMFGGTHRLGAGAGGDWKDYDNDGDLDLLYPRLIHSYLHKYRDLPGSGIFIAGESSTESLAQVGDGLEVRGVAYEERHAGGTWGDVNNDGLLDAFFSTAGDCRFAELYTQNPDHTFSSGTFEYGLHWSSAGEDGVWVDYDNDGWLDLCAIEWDRLRIYKNPGDGGHSGFVEIDAVNADGRIDPGTSVTVHAGDRRINREVVIGRGILMADPPRLHFGLGPQHSIDSVAVQWPDGMREVFTDVEPNKIHRLVKGSSDNLRSKAVAAISAVPNPFTDQLHIYYSIPQNQSARLEIYDQRGTLVKVLLDEEVTAGDHSAVWDAVDAAGDKVPGGVYIYRLVLPGGEVSGRAVLTR